MKQKTLFLGIGLVALSISAVATTVFVSKNNSLVKATTPTDYRQTLVFDASNIVSGSGTVVVNGNSFEYKNVTVEDNKLTFATNSVLKFLSESGDSISGEGYVGGSFKSFGFTSIGDCEFTYKFDDVTGLTASGLDGELVEKAVNTTSFVFKVTAGSFSTNAFLVKYDCVAPINQRVLLVGETDFLDNSNYHANQAYTSLITSLGGQVTVDTLLTTTKSGSRPNYTMAVLAKTSTNFYKGLTNLLNENAYDSIVLQISQRCTQSADDVEACEIAALTSLKNKLHAETDNIYIFATQQSEDNPVIYSNTDNLKYSETENHEEATFSEMCAYYSELANTMAEAVDGKAMHFADCYSQYKRPTSEGGLGYSINYASLRYMYANVMYSTFFNRLVPPASTYHGENGDGEGAATDKAMKGVKTVVSNNCLN